MVAVVASSKTYTSRARVRSPAASAMLQPTGASKAMVWVRVSLVALTSGLPKETVSRMRAGRVSERLRMECMLTTWPAASSSSTAPKTRLTYSPLDLGPE